MYMFIKNYRLGQVFEISVGRNAGAKFGNTSVVDGSI